MEKCSLAFLTIILKDENRSNFPFEKYDQLACSFRRVDLVSKDHFHLYGIIGVVFFVGRKVFRHVVCEASFDCIKSGLIQVQLQVLKLMIQDFVVL